jgi:hypothetical protein
MGCRDRFRIQVKCDWRLYVMYFISASNSMIFILCSTMDCSRELLRSRTLLATYVLSKYCEAITSSHIVLAVLNKQQNQISKTRVAPYDARRCLFGVVNTCNHPRLAVRTGLTHAALQAPVCLKLHEKRHRLSRLYSHTLVPYRQFI